MKELGETLKAERLRQGLTLEHISKQTRISLNILRTLEEGDFDRIGTPLLIRSFVRNYCAALQIDAEPLLEDHLVEISAYDQQQQGLQSYRRWALASGRRRGKGMLVALFLILVAGAAGFVTMHVIQKKAQAPGNQFVGRDINPQEEIPADLSQSVASAPKKGGQITTAPIPKQSVAPAVPAKPPAASESQAQSQPAPTATAAPAQPPAQAVEAVPSGPGPSSVSTNVQPPAAPPPIQGHRLKVEAVQKVWLQVKIDGKTTHSVLLEPGDKRQWEAQTSMRILLGNAGGVQMQWDGQPLRSLGRSGQVVRLTLPDPKYLLNNAAAN